MDTSKAMSDIPALSFPQILVKRIFDFSLALIGLACVWWLIVLAFLAACYDTRSNGFFVQNRVGRGGRIIKVIKIKTMRPDNVITTTVTHAGDPRITPMGRFFRRTKIDELPQLWNVLMGDMSFVGPRPDVPGFADTLVGVERAIMCIRPGITGPATLKYRDEEEILAAQRDPEQYNREVIYPDKVQINLQYIRDWSFSGDIRYILRTVFD